jgi:hypothetical protein
MQHSPDRPRLSTRRAAVQRAVRLRCARRAAPAAGPKPPGGHFPLSMQSRPLEAGNISERSYGLARSRRHRFSSKAAVGPSPGSVLLSRESGSAPTTSSALALRPERVSSIPSAEAPALSANWQRHGWDSRVHLRWVRRGHPGRAEHSRGDRATDRYAAGHDRVSGGRRHRA